MTARPGYVPLGGPPADFARRELTVVEFADPLIRIHRAGLDAVHFSRGSDNRFDDPADPPGFGVLYAATSIEGAFSEVFGRHGAPVVIDEQDLASRSAARLDLRRKLRLADMTGAGARRAGATGEISTCPYAVSRPWAAAIAAHPDDVDGIRYRGRHDNDTFCVAVFDRARTALAPVVPLLRRLDVDRALLAGLLDRYGFGLA